MRLGLWVGALLLSACLPEYASPSSHVDAAPLGEDGRFASVTTRETMQRGLDGTRAVTLVLPLISANDPTSLPNKVPAVVFVQGGLVERERYLWIARHLASRGIATIIPEYTGWLAFFEPDIAAAAADHLESRLADRLGHVAVMGHSLGGVMAVRALLDDSRMDSLVLLASQAADGDPIGDEKRPLLSISGALDESIGPDRTRPTFEGWGGPAFWARVDVLTHFSWTDPGHDPTVLRETEKPSPDLKKARHSGLWLVDAMLDWRLLGDENAHNALLGQQLPPLGTELEVRP